MTLSRVGIFTGQSNEAGEFSGAVPSHLQTPDAGIKIWTGSSWDTLNNGTNNQTLSGAAGFWGPEAEFAYQFRLKFPTETFYIFKYAVGSTNLTYWIPGGVGYAAMTAALPAALAALTNPNIDVLDITQGEDDASNSALAAAWQSNAELWYAAAKANWRVNEATRVTVTQVNPSDGRPYLSTVRAGQAAFCAADPAVRILNDASGYSYQIDGVHYDANGYVTCGGDKFTNYLKGRRSRMMWG